MRKLLFIICFLITNIIIAQKKIESNNYLETSKQFYKDLAYDSAYTYAKKSYTFFNTKKNDSLTFASLLELFRSSDKLNNNEADGYLESAKSLAKKLNNPSMVIDAYYYEANSYFFKDDLVKALPLFLKIDSISNDENIKNKTSIEAILKRGEISRIKFTKETTLAAEKLYLEALKVAKEIKSEEMINYIYTYLADVSGLNGNDSQSKEYIDLAFNYFKKNNDIRNLSQVYLLYTVYFLGIDDLQNAKKYQVERLNYLRSTDDKIELARALVYNGSFHRRKTKDFNQAIKSLEEAKTIYNNINNPSIIKTDNYERLLYSLAICNYEVKQYKTAFEYFDQAYDLREDLIKKSSQELTSSLEVKYQTAKKEEEIALLTAQQALIEQQKKNQTYLFLGIITLVALSAGFLIFGYRNKIKTARKLKELDELKSKFFANISHEFRTPLTLIKSPLQLLKQEETNTKKNKNLNLIEQHSNRMLDLVNQLLELSKIDSGNLKLILQKGDLHIFLQTIAEPYQLIAKQEQLTFTKQIETFKNPQWFDKDVIEKICTNLLTNALKYTTKGGSITFGVSKTNNTINLKIANTTNSTDAKDISKLFERFYQENDSHHGFGIGLSLVKELITLYRGTISSKIENNMLVLEVNLPLDIDLLKDISIIKETTESEVINSTVKDTNEDHPILLIVDDNESIRSVLKDIFKAKYQILEAADGVSALKIAVEEIPDLIISDVMMPKMDGFELTEKLKQNEATSFIPIILLTAKTSDESRLKGLQNEADDYITKPFNHDILAAKVQQLIDLRIQLRERYSKELILKPKDIAINSVDEKFIEKLQTVLDKQLSNSDFTADDFSKEIGMSRMQLHRKLKSLLGVSTTEFLRNERLKAAANLLLKKGNINISEIAYSVGFNDVSYFSKCFKEAYNVSPSEYATT